MDDWPHVRRPSGRDADLGAVRLHCVGLPHTTATSEFVWCAYSGKLLRFGEMLKQYGHSMVLYSGTENEAVCEEHVPIVTDRELDRWFGGPWDRQKVFDRWDPTDPCWVEMNQLAISAIRERWEPGDAVGIIAGQCQGALVDAFPNQLAVEWGVGYGGVIDQTFRAFESHAWRHYVSGIRHEGDGRLYDTVINNAYDPADFRPDLERDDYLLFLGRLTARKGLAIVQEIAKHHRVITAGQGEPLDGIEHRGIVLGDEKAELLGRARGLLSPSQYIEPFGGVAVEAQLSGTPVISTDFGAYPETVSHGVTGFRCSTLAEFLTAARRVDELDHAEIAHIARSRFSLDAIAPKYDRWLNNLATLYADGWYTTVVPSAS